jgi:hypothetical protein
MISCGTALRNCSLAFATTVVRRKIVISQNNFGRIRFNAGITLKLNNADR